MARLKQARYEPWPVVSPAHASIEGASGTTESLAGLSGAVRNFGIPRGLAGSRGEPEAGREKLPEGPYGPFPILPGIRPARPFASPQGASEAKSPGKRKGRVTPAP